MNRAGFLEAAWLYAARALSPEEMRACDEFLREDADEECRAALRRAQRAWVQLGMSLEPVRPDERVWQGIERSLRVAREAPLARRAGRGRERLAWALAACALFAAALLEGRREAALDRLRLVEARAASSAAQATELADANDRALRSEKAEREACVRSLETALADSAARALALAILQSPGSRVLALAPQAGSAARATALLDLKGHRAALVASAMPAAAARDYELWVIRGSDKIAAGLIKPDASGAAIVSVDPALLAGAIDALAITLEPAGGGPAPRGPLVLVATVKG